MPNPMPLEAPVTMATGFSLVFAVIAFFFDLFVILPTQITARIPLGKANRTRTFKVSRNWRGGIGIGVEWGTENCNESTRQPRPVRMNQGLISFAMPASAPSISSPSEPAGSDWRHRRIDEWPRPASGRGE